MSGSPRGEDDELTLIDKHLAMLSEHYENVHIFASRLSEDGKSTTTVQRGIGNWYARYGQIKSFLLKEDEAFRVQARINAERYEEDGNNSDE